MFLPATRADKKRRRKSRALTLFECLVAMTVGTLVVLVLVPTTVYTATSLASLANYLDMNTLSVRAVDQLTTDIRSAARLASFSTNRVVLEFLSGPPAIYQYTPATGNLTRTRDGQEQLLLTGCKTLTFSIYQRTPIPKTYDQYPAATNSEAKVVAMHWSTSRRLTGDRSNEDQVQSAKVVIRCR